MARPRRAEQLHDVDLDDLADGASDEVAVAQALEALPSADDTQRLAQLFSALSDPNRVRLVAALERSELCVGDLAAITGLSQSATSHQLRSLRSLGLVRAERSGRQVFYSLDDDHVRSLFRQALDHVAHQ